MEEKIFRGYINVIGTKRFITCIIIIFITLFIYIGYLYNHYVTNLNDLNYRTSYINSLEWTFIKSLIYEDYLAAENQAKLVADRLTNNLRNEYPDLNELKNELENTRNKKINAKYFYIMQQTIVNHYLFDVNYDDNNNNIFICNKYGVLANTSRRAKQNIKDFPLLWTEIYEEQTNIELTKKAVEYLFQQRNKLIYWEFPNNEGLSIPAEIDIENLHYIYDTYGIDGFKNIQFLAPAYITTTGDIFGIEDIDIYGRQQENYKLVVVQTFNLYQQLMARYSDEMTKINLFKEHIIQHPLNSLYIHGVFIILIIVMMIILITFILVNREYYHQKKSK